MTLFSVIDIFGSSHITEPMFVNNNESRLHKSIHRCDKIEIILQLFQIEQNALAI